MDKNKYSKKNESVPLLESTHKHIFMFLFCFLEKVLKKT